MVAHKQAMDEMALILRLPHQPSTHLSGISLPPPLLLPSLLQVVGCCNESEGSRMMLDVIEYRAIVGGMLSRSCREHGLSGSDDDTVHSRGGDA